MARKVLIAPLNWGLGHAARCLPLVEEHLRSGDEVVLAGDGESLVLLRKHFPSLRVVHLAPLRLRYSASRSQVWAMLRALPRLLVWALRDRRAFRALMAQENFDLVLSDNRFALYGPRSVYMTHQLTIPLPRRFRSLEPFLAHVHARIIKRYRACWVPDYAAAPSLSGRLGHPVSGVESVRYIGPLSRFRYVTPKEGTHYQVVAVLSGLEPQRTLLEQQLIREAEQDTRSWLIVRGKVGEPVMRMQRRNLTLVPSMDDGALMSALLHAEEVVARSGYSTIMDLEVLGLLEKAQAGGVCLRLIPTPGQPEQEYLAELCCSNR